MRPLEFCAGNRCSLDELREKATESMKTMTCSPYCKRNIHDRRHGGHAVFDEVLSHREFLCGNLLLRAADVTLKQRRPLILVFGKRRSMPAFKAYARRY